MFEPLVRVVRTITPNFVRRSFALKFLIAFLVLGFMVTGVSAYGTFELTDQIKDDSRQQYAQLAGQEARNLEAWHQQNQVIVDTLRNVSQVKSRDPATVRGYLSSVSSNRGDRISSIHYVDTESGEILASTNGDMEGEPISAFDSPWTSKVGSAEDVTVTEVYQGPNAEGGRSLVAYTAAVGRDQSVQDDRAIVVTVRPSAYNSEFQDINASQSLVVGADGNIIFSQAFNTGFDYDKDSETSAPVQAATEAGPNKPGAMTFEATDSVASVGDTFEKDQNVIVGYARVPDTPWTVLVHTSTSNAFGFAQTVEQGGIVVIFLMLGAIGLVGGVLGRNTSVAIGRLTQKMGELEAGNLDIDLDTGRVDSIGRLYEGSDNMRVALKAQIEASEQARLDAEQARQEAEDLAQHLELKADQYSEVMRKCAAGDFTQRMDPESQSQPMTDIANEFNEMIGVIEGTTEELKTFAEEVATASEEVTASSEEVQSASERIARSTQEISDGANRQSENLDTISAEMGELSETTDEIATSSNQVASLAQQTATTGERGRKAAEKAADGISEIEEASDQAVEEIDKLEAEMAEIDELVEFISEVASETNMLALNANIEASRAGSDAQQEEGFAVVAQRVKEFAEDTKEAAQDIEDRLEGIKAQTRTAADEVETASERVEGNAQSIQEAIETLDEIASYAEKTSNGVQEINAATQQQAATTQEVVAMVEEVATISKETTNESEKVAAAAEEQTASTRQVSESASDLAREASILSETLDQFDTAAAEDIEMLEYDEDETPLPDDTDELLDDGSGDSPAGAGASTPPSEELKNEDQLD